MHCVTESKVICFVQFRKSFVYDECTFSQVHKHTYVVMSIVEFSLFFYIKLSRFWFAGHEVKNEENILVLSIHCIVASSNTCLKPHPVFYILLMKGIFDA